MKSEEKLEMIIEKEIGMEDNCLPSSLHTQVKFLLWIKTHKDRKIYACLVNIYVPHEVKNQCTHAKRTSQLM